MDFNILVEEDGVYVDKKKIIGEFIYAKIVTKL